MCRVVMDIQLSFLKETRTNERHWTNRAKKRWLDDLN